MSRARGEEGVLRDDMLGPDVIFRRSAGVAAIAWMTFIVYGSLLPFDFVAQPIAVALERFRHIPLLPMELADRPDWMANLLLYAPLAFLGGAAIGASQSQSRAQRVRAAVLAVIGAGALAVFVEFAQIFFPPRTVSLNDLLAEWLGALAGALAWLAWGERANRLRIDIMHGGPAAAAALGIAYAIAYVLLALFPYDFVLTAREFHQKDAGQLGWWVASRGCAHAIQCGAQLAAEALFALLLGIVFWGMRKGSAQTPLWAVASIGLLLGGAIEAAQLLIASGVSQGISVVAKALGFVAGTLLAPRIGGLLPGLLRSSHLRPLLSLCALLYLGAFASIAGMVAGKAIAWHQAIARLADVNWLPFYNYYYTSEPRAVASALVQAALYFPAGILVALSLRGAGRRHGALIAVGATAALALVAQGARLFFPPARPDPTDVLIGICSGWGGHALTGLVARIAGSETAAAPTGPAVRVGRYSPFAVEMRGVLLVLVALGLGVFVFQFPVLRIGLALALAAWFWLLYRIPEAWIVGLFALLPTLDLAPWSGRYYFDEFDAFAGASFAVAALRMRAIRAPAWPGWLLALFGLLIVSALISIARAVLPWPDEALRELGGYQSPLNAFRVGRAFVWACLLIWLLGRTPPQAPGGDSRFAIGMTIGLLGVGLIVLWERVVFTGLLNFAHEYRVSGTFSAISTAGAQIESYLAAATPFALLLALRARRMRVRALAIVALGLMLYAVASTASRSAYAGVGLAIALMTLAWLWTAQGVAPRLFIAFIIAALATLTWIAVGGTYVTQRMADTGNDWSLRKAHWALVRSLIGPDLVTQLLGEGMGQYPARFFWNAPRDRRPATFAFGREGASGVLKLGSGHAVYLEQFVPFERAQIYAVSGRLRTQPGDQGVLAIALCDKWILYGLDCVGATVATPGAGNWAAFSRTLTSSNLGRGPPFFRRPVKFALYNVGPSTIDVAGIALEDASGRNILVNGDFASGGDRWYFSADDHFPWNIFNLFLETFFEQGWLGLVVFVGLFGAVMASLGARAARGNLLAAAFFASVAGYMVPALFDSVIDDPRMRFLLLFLLCGSVFLTRSDPGRPAGLPGLTLLRGLRHRE